MGSTSLKPNLTLALTKLIELCGMTLHDQPEYIEREVILDIIEGYSDVSYLELRQAYNEWIKEYNNDKATGGKDQS